MEKKLLYLNAEFDLRIGGYELGRQKTILDEISVYFQILGNSDDSVIMKSKPIPEYYFYLDSLGIEYAKIANKDEVLEKNELFLWAIDNDSVEQINSYGLEFDFPDLDVIKKINSKEYSNEISKQIGLDSGTVCYSENQVYDFLEEKKEFPIVIKSSFGSAGTGFIIKDIPDWKKADVKKLRRIFSVKGAAVIIEKWRDRVSDFSISFNILRDGKIDEILFNRTESCKKGVFRAVYPDYFEKELLKVQDELKKTAITVSKKLFKEGYFGPVGIDSYTYLDNSGKLKLNSLSEINARLTMAIIPRTLRKKYGNPEYVSLLSVPRQKLKEISNYDEYYKIFSKNKFDGKYGILLVTPLKFIYNEDRKSPSKYFFYVAAETKKILSEYISYIENL